MESDSGSKRWALMGVVCILATGPGPYSCRVNGILCVFFNTFSKKA